MSDPLAVKAEGLIDNQTRYMSQLIDNVLDIFRSGHDKLCLRSEEVNLAAVMAKAVETVTPLIESNRHRMNMTAPPEDVVLTTDASRLRQILVNLLNNAAKYTEPGGQIWLTAERLDGQVVLHVRDNGIGISPEMLPHLFEMYAQANRTRERSQGGLGIGLALVRKLTEALGGNVSVSSAGEGHGSDFVVRLPYYD